MSTNDVQMIDHWAGWLGLPEQVVAALASAVSEVVPERLSAYREMFAAGKDVEAGAEPVTAAIAALLTIPVMLEHHRRMGLSEAVSRATAADITLWINDHHRRLGVWGLSQTGWIHQHLGGRVIRLGRLQFKLGTCHLPLRASDPLRPDDPILEVHISAGEPLLPEACLDSFAQARRCFTGPEWRGFTCVTWLLAPRLCEVLPVTSNILTFQKFFVPLPCTMNDRQTIERIFGAWPLDLQHAPRATTLQRAVLDFYARGGRLDGGAGFIIR